MMFTKKVAFNIFNHPWILLELTFFPLGHIEKLTSAKEGAHWGYE